MIPARILGGYGKLAPKRVVQVAGTTTYSLALTSDGQVYGFGQRFSTDRDFCVRKLGGPCVTRVMTSIACNDNYPFGVLDSGEVATLLEPRYEKIDMKGLAISKIVCGKSHALALSFDGKVYSGGRSNNEYGQLGNGTTNVGHNLYPMEFISEAIGRVKDIATVNYDEKQPCAAITEKNEVYIWGHYNGQNYLSPSKTTFSTLDEVFAGLGITCRSLKPKERILEVAPLKPKISSPSNTLYDCAGRIIDDAESSDFAFLVEGKKIHVHKLILMMRCTVFKTMFQESNTASEHTIEGHSYVAFYAFLKYFYTDEIDLPPDSALELLALAHFYHLPALQEKCGKFIKRGVTVENAAVIFEKAIQYEAKELEEYVFKFCVDHMTDVISSDAFKTFKPDTVSEFLRRAAQHGAFKN
ncbi:RCC1 and BTB domain-containing protein 1-like isoform X2 [Cloeon dipterum]|uniref:RCC1 and BTB domain-containing protein 1-like isoform X2 n=1 Tax=Cloeon dipterum TaxID=197152 RepID=UPI0032207F6F